MMLKRWLGLVLAFGMIIMCSLIVFPIVQKHIVPESWNEEVDKRGIDPTGLFYTESSEALEAYLMFKLHPPQDAEPKETLEIPISR